jgi:hypothetical protein
MFRIAWLYRSHEEATMAERNPYYTDVQSSCKPPDWDAERAATGRIEEIHQYLRDRYARREVVARTVTRSGQELDWVPIESQTADGQVATPPDIEISHVAYDEQRPTERAPLTLEYPEAELGPPGTVPLVRLPIDRIRPGSELRDWLSKTGRARRTGPPDADPESRKVGYNIHAAAKQLTTCYGTEGIMNVWRPYVERSSEFSLGQFWLSRGQGTQNQTVEAGLQVYPGKYGDWEPHVFIFYNTNGYTAFGDNIGGYNQDVDGWVQTSNLEFPGGLVTALSQTDGIQYDMAFRGVLSSGNWWIDVGGEWMGYYPATLFNSTGLRSQADELSWGGEVIDVDPPSETTATDMGSGRFPWEAFRRAAYLRNITYQYNQSGATLPFGGLALVTEKPNCYGIAGDFSSGSPWGTHYYWGGTGRNGQCP